jgi:hypothetical protein
MNLLLALIPLGILMVIFRQSFSLALVSLPVALLFWGMFVLGF